MKISQSHDYNPMITGWAVGCTLFEHAGNRDVKVIIDDDKITVQWPENTRPDGVGSITSQNPP